MPKNFKRIIAAAILLLLVAAPASAQLVTCGRKGQTTACTLTDLFTMVYRTLNFLLNMAGTVAILFIVVGGVQMLVSGGDPGRIKTAKDTIKNAITGLVIILISYVLVAYVANLLALPGDPLLRQFLPG